MVKDKSFLRTAPRPLSVYLGAAMALLPADAAQRAQHQNAVERMVRGIKKYQAHTYRRENAPRETVWTEGGSALFRFPAAKSGGQVLLLIPSMINGPEILDLYPGRSFARWLAERGYEVYLLDWGTSATDSGLQSLDDGVVPRLARAAAFVAAKAGAPPDTVGYCMGGTLLLAAAACAPHAFGRLVLLSAPWDFHAGDPRMLAQVKTGTPMALQLLEEKAALPVDWIQNVFARVNPALALSKFSSFLDMAAGSVEEEVFIAVEDWLNNGQDLSAGVARVCILDWYGRNLPGQGAWIDLNVLKNKPVLVIAAARDILVPPESAVAVAQALPQTVILRPPCGHISLMAGRRALSDVWEPLQVWLAAG